MQYFDNKRAEVQDLDFSNKRTIQRVFERLSW